ncbi:hypothetical protein AMECASPLE_022186 [Ameca splendens]|uniref:Uncharacterized protein n=1 Tax=Ameca splendens TaxID=208324 RepID=A0ABV0Y3P7_9TELE
MIKTIYVLRTSFPISCLRLDSHQAGSFLLPSSPGPSRNRTLSTLQASAHQTHSCLPQAHTEQHLKNLLQTQPRQTWFLNPSTLGDLTTPIYWRIIRYVPDYHCLNKHPLLILFSGVFSVCGSDLLETK